MALHQMLADQRDEVMLRWNGQVRGTLAPEAMPALELTDHLPEFLDEIVSALRSDAGLASRGPLPEVSATAAGHGAQRLRLGFSLDAVVREYGALRDAIVQTTRDAGAQLTDRELQVLFDVTVSGIAHAVSEYTHQRDAELV
ncbi:MAG: RsbRD N-terminal domain-containing protein, partial [Candidatus Eisenbacteria bacterium]